MGVVGFILASTAVALAVAQGGSVLGCSNLIVPVGSANYYVPSTECREANGNVDACFIQWGLCGGNATACDQVNVCLQSFFICLYHIPAPAVPETNTSAPCYSWTESFNNVKVNQDRGGAYLGSGLQTACNYAACNYTASAPKLNNGAVCLVPSSTCSAAPQAPATYEVQMYALWDVNMLTNETLSDITRGALQRGLADGLGIADHAIRIFSFRAGAPTIGTAAPRETRNRTESIVVEFAILDPTEDGANMATRLNIRSSIVLNEMSNEVSRKAPQIIYGPISRVQLLQTRNVLTEAPVQTSSPPVNGVPPPTPAPTASCASVQLSDTSMNYFVPPDDCRAANTDVEACFTQWTQCTGNATTCNAVNVCLQSVLICLDNIPAPAVPERNISAPCYGWNESLANVKMYLDMGGAYSGSTLQAACDYAACSYIVAAPKLNGGSVCGVHSVVCDAAPKPPPKFVLTFAGDWSTLVTSKASQIRVALQRGIAKLLNVPEYFIRVLSFKSGSLIVEFAVLDPTVDGRDAATKLLMSVGNTAVVATAFAELQTAAGFAIELESVDDGDGNSVTFAPIAGVAAPTRAPPITYGPTPVPRLSPTRNSASAVSAIIASALIVTSLLV